MAANVLKNKESAAIKSKLSRMIKTYGEIKRHNEQTGVERKDWEWFDKMDSLLGSRENISPSFIANRFTDVENEETLGSESKSCKKLKKNNVDTIAAAISTMSESRERVWDKKLELKKEKMAIELSKLEVEKKKWEFEREKMKMEYELRLKEMECRLNNQSSN